MPQDPLKKLDQAHKKFQKNINKIQKQRWSDFIELMEILDKADIQAVKDEVSK